MPHIRSAGTAACLAEMLHANHRHLGAEALATGAEALAHICDTEDFVTYRVRPSSGSRLKQGRKQGARGAWDTDTSRPRLDSF